MFIWSNYQATIKQIWAPKIWATQLWLLGPDPSCLYKQVHCLLDNNGIYKCHRLAGLLKNALIKTTLYSCLILNNVEKLKIFRIFSPSMIWWNKPCDQNKDTQRAWITENIAFLKRLRKVTFGVKIYHLH